MNEAKVGLSEHLVERLMQNFLEKEYEECFKQLRSYDERHERLLTFVLMLTSAVATAIVAIWKSIPEPTRTIYLLGSLVCFVVFIATLLVLGAVVQNRLYYVFVVRQINAIRKFGLTSVPTFNENQMQLSTKFLAIKPLSVHSLIIICINLLSAIFFSLSAFAFLMSKGSNNATSLSLVFGFIAFVVELGVAYSYLRGKSSQPGDTAGKRVSP